jgi:hypothetical protein
MVLRLMDHMALLLHMLLLIVFLIDGTSKGFIGALATQGEHGRAGSMGSVVVCGEGSMGSLRRTWEEEENEKGMGKTKVIGGHFNIDSFIESILKTFRWKPKGHLLVSI